MKLKKGSKEAKAFMAKLRNARKGAVKKTIRKVKKATLKGAVKKMTNNTITAEQKIASLTAQLQALPTNENGQAVDVDAYLLIADELDKLEEAQNKKATLKGVKHTDNNSHNYRISISGLNGKRNHLLSDLKNRFGYLSTTLLTAAKAADKKRIKKELSEIRKEIHQLTKKLK